MNRSDAMLLWLVLKRKNDDLQGEINACENTLKHQMNSFIDQRDAENDREVEFYRNQLSELREKRDHLKKRILNIEKEITCNKPPMEGESRKKMR